MDGEQAKIPSPVESLEQDAKMKKVRISLEQLRATALKVERWEKQEQLTSPVRQVSLSGRSRSREVSPAGRARTCAKQSRVLSKCSILSRAVQETMSSASSASKPQVSDSRLREINAQHRLAKKGFAGGMELADLRQHLGKGSPDGGQLEATGSNQALFPGSAEKREHLFSTTKRHRKQTNSIDAGSGSLFSHALLGVVTDRQKGAFDVAATDSSWMDGDCDDSAESFILSPDRKRKRDDELSRVVLDGDSHRLVSTSHKRSQFSYVEDVPAGKKKTVSDLRSRMSTKCEPRLSILFAEQSS